MPSLRSYLDNAFRWRRGRQGTGYDKMLLATATWPIRFDSYLIRYPEGSEIPPHTDPVSDGRHYRLNIVLSRPGRAASLSARTRSSRRAASSCSGPMPASTA